MKKLSFIACVLCLCCCLWGCIPKPGGSVDIVSDLDMLFAVYQDMLTHAPEKLGLSAARLELALGKDFGGFTDGMLTICPTDPRCLGLTVHTLFDGALPAWFCVGYELCSLNDAGAFNGGMGLATSFDKYMNIDISESFRPLEWAVKQSSVPFGDAWFVPGLVSAAEQTVNQASVVAMLFTRYLLDNEPAEFYTALAASDEDRLYAAWADFIGGAGAPIDASCRYKYGDGSGLQFTIESDDMYYEFYESGWQMAKVSLFVSDAAEKTRFIVNWFGLKPGEVQTPVFCFYKNEPETGGGGSRIVLVDPKSADRFVVAHKTAIYYAAQLNLITANTHWALAAGFAEFLAYESLPDADRDFMIKNADILALEDLKNPGEPAQADPGYMDYPQYDTSELETQQCSQSFVRYIYKTYGRDGLLMVLPALDDDVIERQTGKTCREIIEDWIKYLPTAVSVG